MRQLTSPFTRYGRGALIALAVIVCAGFMVRAWVVVNPLSEPGDDSLAYRALAEALYVDGTFGYEEGSAGGPEFETPSDWSPGAPLIYAGAYYLTGGVRDGVARGVEAVFGSAAILLAFLLTARLLGPPRAGPKKSRGRQSAIITESSHLDSPRTGFGGDSAVPRPGWRHALGPLAAAGLVAFYPPFIHSTGALMSEPPAIFMLPFSVLAFIWADGRVRARKAVAAGGNGSGPAGASRSGRNASAGRSSAWSLIWPWFLPGLGFGLTALIRPEYLSVCVAFTLLLLIRAWLSCGPKLAIGSSILFVLAALVPIIPWSVHNYVQLDRIVPISTGSGKALFTGTYYPGDGEYQQVKAELLQDQTGRRLDPHSEALEKVDPVPLFDRAAKEYKAENDLPGIDRDAALGRLGRENLERYFTDDPFGYVGMTFRKVGRMWSSGIGEAMSSPLGRGVQILLVLAGLAGLVLLAWRRRWEWIAVGLPIATVTAVAAVTLAPPRRNEILMMLVLPLAAVALDALLNRAPKDAGNETP